MGNLCCGPRKPTEDVEEIPLTGVDSTSVIVTEQPGYNGDRQAKITNLQESNEKGLDIKTDETESNKPRLYITAVQDKLQFIGTAIEITHAEQVETLQKHSKIPLVLHSNPKVIISFYYLKLFNGTIFSIQSLTRAVSPDLKTIQQISIQAVQLFNIIPKTMIQPRGVFQEYTTTLVTLHPFKVSFGMFEPLFKVFRSSTSIVNTNVVLMKSFLVTKPTMNPIDNFQVFDNVKHQDFALKSPLCVPVGTSIMMNFMMEGLNSHSLFWNGNVSPAVASGIKRTLVSHLQVMFSFKSDVASWNHTLSMNISVGNTQSNVTDSENIMTSQIDMLSVRAMISSILLKLPGLRFGRPQATLVKTLPLDYDLLIAISDTPLGYSHRNALIEQIVIQVYGLITEWSTERLNQTMVCRKLLRQTAGRPLDWQDTKTVHVSLIKDILGATTYQVEDWFLRMTQAMDQKTNEIVRKPFTDKDMERIEAKCPRMVEYTTQAYKTHSQSTVKLPIRGVSKTERYKKRPVLGDVAGANMASDKTGTRIRLKLAIRAFDVNFDGIDKHISTEKDIAWPRELDIDFKVTDVAKYKIIEDDKDKGSKSDSFDIEISDVDSQASYGSLIMLSDTEDEQYCSQSPVKNSDDDDSMSSYKQEQRAIVNDIIGQTIDSILFTEHGLKDLKLATNEKGYNANSESVSGESVTATMLKTPLIDNNVLLDHTNDSDSDDSMSLNLGDNENANNVNSAFNRRTTSVTHDSRNVANHNPEFDQHQGNCTAEKWISYVSYNAATDETDGYVSATDSDNYAGDDDTDCDFSFSDIECDKSFTAVTTDANEFKGALKASWTKDNNHSDNEAELIQSLFDTSDSESELSDEDIPKAGRYDHIVNLDDPKQSKSIQNEILTDEGEQGNTDRESDDETSDNGTSDTESELSESEILRALQDLRDKEIPIDDPKQSRILRKPKDNTFVRNEAVSHGIDLSRTDIANGADGASDAGLSASNTLEAAIEFNETETMTVFNREKDVNIDYQKQPRVADVQVADRFVQNENLTREGDHGHVQDLSGNSNSDHNSNGSEKTYGDDHGDIHESIHDSDDHRIMADKYNADYYSGDETDEYYEEDGPVLSYNFPYFTRFSSRQEELAYLEWQDIPPVSLDMRRCVLDTAENYVAAPRSEEDRCGSILAMKEERERRREEAERLRRCVEKYIF